MTWWHYWEAVETRRWGLVKGSRLLRLVFEEYVFSLATSCHTLSMLWGKILLLCVCVCVCVWYWGLNSGPLPWATPSAQFFVVGFFEIGSHELFAWAGLQLWSSWSLWSWVARLQVWATGAQRAISSNITSTAVMTCFTIHP
jgi:hypothetical protein